MKCLHGCLVSTVDSGFAQFIPLTHSGQPEVPTEAGRLHYLDDLNGAEGNGGSPGVAGDVESKSCPFIAAFNG